MVIVGAIVALVGLVFTLIITAAVTVVSDDQVDQPVLIFMGIIISSLMVNIIMILQYLHSIASGG